MYEGSQIKPTDYKMTETNNDGKAFCVNCGKRQPYEVSFSFETVDRKGIIFTYLNMRANCVICKSDLYVREINDANVQSRLLAYEDARRKHTPK